MLAVGNNRNGLAALRPAHDLRPRGLILSLHRHHWLAHMIERTASTEGSPKLVSRRRAPPTFAETFNRYAPPARRCARRRGGPPTSPGRRPRPSRWCVSRVGQAALHFAGRACEQGPGRNRGDLVLAAHPLERDLGRAGLAEPAGELHAVERPHHMAHRSCEHREESAPSARQSMATRSASEPAGTLSADGWSSLTAIVPTSSTSIAAVRPIDLMISSLVIAICPAPPRTAPEGRPPRQRNVHAISPEVTNVRCECSGSRLCWHSAGADQDGCHDRTAADSVDPADAAHRGASRIRSEGAGITRTGQRACFGGRAWVASRPGDLARILHDRAIPDRRVQDGGSVKRKPDLQVRYRPAGAAGTAAQ